MADLPESQNTLYLVDVSSFIFRAFFAVRNLSNKKGEPTNAVYGVAQMFSRLATDANPVHMAVVYDSPPDSPVKSFRKEMYPEYKANRSAPPDELIPQFARIEQMITAFEIHSYRFPGMEADDLIATLTKRWCAADPLHRVVIVSGDKDLMQLVNPRVQLWDTMNNKIYGEAEVEEKFAVKPAQIRDYLSLVGDSSDNIPGVPSIGPKSASDLLKAHGTLDGVLAAAEAGQIAGKKGETIRANVAAAHLSRDLVALRDELPVEVNVRDFDYRFHMTESLIKLFRELDFDNLITRWRADAPPATDADLEVLAATSQVNSKLHGEFKAIMTEAALAAVLKQIERVGEFGFDLETTSLNPREAEIVGIALCCDDDVGYYIPIGHRGMDVGDTVQLPLKLVLDRLRPYLEDPRYKKIGQNLKYDWSVLKCQGLEPVGIGADTMVASYVIDPGGRHNLTTLCAVYLDYTVLTYEQVCGSGKDQIGFDLVSIEQATRYSGEDAWIAWRLWKVLLKKLQEQKLMEVFARVDLPLVEVLCEMENYGVAIDTAWLAQLSGEFGQDLRRIEERVSAFTSGPVNLGSPKQLAVLLFDELKLPPQGKTKTGYSTDASVLEALEPLHEVPRLLLEHREISKLKGTYVDPLPLLVDKRTGRIHAGFHQTVAATGRLSSSNPNLQNIPIRSERGRKIRRAFVPEKGWWLVSADYSQIELRLLAHMSGDVELKASFIKDEDVHRRTASEIFGVKPEAVDEHQRNVAKAINFGLMYGKSAFALAQELKIGRREAQDTIDKYFARYRGVKHYLDHLIVEAKERGYAETLLGRKRLLPEINAKNPAIRSGAERMAMNTPIQGTAADLMKLAMTEIRDRLHAGRFSSRVIIQVHDEVVLECPEDEVDRAERLVVEAMENCEALGMKLSVPLRVNTGRGRNWMDA